MATAHRIHRSVLVVSVLVTAATIAALAAPAGAAIATNPVPTQAAPTAASDTATTQCSTGNRYTINYLNGISNTWTQAFRSRAELADAEGTSHGGESITYTNLYNDTHGLAADLKEVFDQKVREAVQTGILTTDQINTILSRVVGTSIRVTTAPTRALGWLMSKVPIDVVRDAGQGMNQFLDALPDWYTSAADALNSWMSHEVQRFADLALLDSETRSIIAAHTATLRAQIASGSKPLIVSHSQGNLFANPIASAVRAATASDALGVVHIATPALLTSGPWVTIDTDLVIAPFDRTGSAPPPNVSLPLGLAGSNHGFAEAYLRAGQSPRALVLSKIDSQLDSLALPAGTGADGVFTVTLTWNGPGDVDLHVIEPNGNHVYYGNKTGTVGYLDVDNTSGNGPEHYYAACIPAAVGTYQVGITNYAAPDGTIATTQLSSSNFVGVPHDTMLGPALSSSSMSVPLFHVVVDTTPDGHLNVAETP